MVAVHVPALAQEMRPTQTQEIRQVQGVCHGPDARDAVFCALAVGEAVACFANEATQSPTFVAWFDVLAVRSVQGGRQGPLTVLGSSHRENGSLPGRK
jgi:hypothetical protein